MCPPKKKSQGPTDVMEWPINDTDNVFVLLSPPLMSVSRADDNSNGDNGGIDETDDGDGDGDTDNADDGVGDGEEAREGE